MPIRVTCPGCRSRFHVSDKFAGKKGPCPKCKAEIYVPTKEEEVQIHAPEGVDLKDPKGRAALAPIFREETQVSPTIWAIIGGSVLTVLVVALVLRFSVEDKTKFPVLVLALGSIVLAPPLALAGYSFLRDDELEPYRGQPLLIRVAICGAVYALIWGIFAFLNVYWFDGQPYQLPQMAYIAPLMIVAGGATAHFSLDLGFGNGMLHYGLYLVVSVLLRLIVGLSAF